MRHVSLERFLISCLKVCEIALFISGERGMGMQCGLIRSAQLGRLFVVFAIFAVGSASF